MLVKAFLSMLYIIIIQRNKVKFFWLSSDNPATAFFLYSVSDSQTAGLMLINSIWLTSSEIFVLLYGFKCE